MEMGDYLFSGDEGLPELESLTSSNPLNMLDICAKGLGSYMKVMSLSFSFLNYLPFLGIVNSIRG